MVPDRPFTLGTIPWYVLLYCGADSFLKLYTEHAPQPDRDAAESSPATG